ncbi:MAG: MFS transporter [Spirochaetaceae bacterium]|jgi:MFS family permease|nr:MFS transporter [Spirochaetaceae bacterium]
MLNDIYRHNAKQGRFLWVLALSGISYGLYRGVQDNFLAEIVHISKFERGIVEFFREIPGLLVILILAAMYRFAESRIFKIGTAIMLAGILGLLFGPAGPGFSAKFSVILFMVIFSAGEHIIMPVKSTISMDLAEPSQGGASLGLTNALDQLGRITGYVAVTFLFFIFGRIRFSGTPRYRIVFAAAAFLILAAVFVSLTMHETKLKGPRRRFYFHRKFFKFYMLEVFYGARKQIFLTFAPYVLILQYGADTSVIALLYAICSGAGFIVSPLLGKLIDRAGYKFVMVTDTLVLVIVCLFYGFSHRIFPERIAYLVVCINFVLDSIISLASMASNVYVKDIASSQEELTATLSTGISVNHLISIAIALLGGWIWERTGIEVLFSLSAFLGIMNSVYAATIKVGRGSGKATGTYRGITGGQDE